MNCPNCGHKNNDSAAYCEACGSVLGSIQSTDELHADASPTHNAPAPNEIKGFNFGAFSLSIFWAPAHRLWLYFFVLLASGLIPFAVFIGFAVSIYLGFKGNELAWKARPFESVKQFKETQRVWTICGILIIVLSIIVTVVAAPFIVPDDFGADKKAGQQSQHEEINNLQDLIEKHYLPEGTWPTGDNTGENIDARNRKGYFENGLTEKTATGTQPTPSHKPRRVSGHHIGIGTHSF